MGVAFLFNYYIMIVFTNIMIVLLPKISDSVLLYLVTRMLHLFIYKTLNFSRSRAGGHRA